jgi:hypothetical protein
MTDLDQRLRAEVLLLVQIAERYEGAQLEGALAAAAAAGVLADDVEWLRVLDRGFEEPEPAEVTPERRAELTSELEGLDPLLRFQALRVAQRVGAIEVDWGASFGEPGAPEPRVERLIGFKAVVPGPPERDGKRVISVECYDGGLLVRSEVAHDVPDDLRSEPEYVIVDHFHDLELHDEVEIEDDVGTRYLPDGGGGSGGLESGRWVSSWQLSYATPVPAEARRLTVAVSGTCFELDVTGVAERPET